MKMVHKSSRCDPTSYGPEEGPEQEEVVEGLLGGLGQLHGLVDDGAEVRLEHELVLGGEKRDGAEDQLEQLQVQIGPLHVGAHLVHPVKQVPKTRKPFFVNFDAILSTTSNYHTS